LSINSDVLFGDGYDCVLYVAGEQLKHFSKRHWFRSVRTTCPHRSVVNSLLKLNFTDNVRGGVRQRYAGPRHSVSKARRRSRLTRAIKKCRVIHFRVSFSRARLTTVHTVRFFAIKPSDGRRSHENKTPGEPERNKASRAVAAIQRTRRGLCRHIFN